MNTTNDDFKYKVAEWRGMVSALLENLEKSLEKMATKESVEAIVKQMDELKDSVNKATIEISNIKETAATEGGKNGTRWAVIISGITIIINIAFTVLAKKL